MKHPRTRTGRSLAGMVLILFGLSAYGCGDSATVTEPASLGNLSVSEGTLTPRFSPDTTSYTVQLSTDVSSTTITATPRVAGDTIRIDNQPVSSQTVTLDSPGAEESVNIVVTETGTGGTSRSYTVRIRRAPLAGDNSLANLTVSPGALSTPFDRNSLDYTVSVDNNIGRITVTPTLSDPLASMTVNGQAAGSGQPHPVDLKGGGQVTPITITVTAQDGSTKSYEVTVSRGASKNNNLSGLTVSSGNLDPPFRADRPGQTAYTVNVSSGVSSVTVRPTLADTTAEVTVNGVKVTSGQSSQSIGLNQAGGSPTIITIIVIAQDGTPKPYSITISRVASGNNNLSGLTIQPGSLAFKADTLTYTVNVGSDVASVAVTATKADPNAVISGDLPNSGQATISLPGSSTVTSTTPILITVTAPNRTSKTYRINVVKAALGGNNNLSGLTIQPGSLAFQSNILTYNVNVNSGIESVRVTATKADPNAVISGDLPNSGQATIPLPGAGPSPSTTPILITVTAPNGTSKTYRINVVKAALGANSNLSALTVSPGTFDSPFNANDLSYTVTVGSAVENVTVSAAKDDSNAVMLIGSVTVPAGTATGQASFPLNGAGGANTTISVTVTAQNGIATKTYTLSVFRPAAPTAPAKPATAPDLITADDSCQLIPGTSTCFPPTSDTDNKTNVKRPGFSVPTPTSGEAVKVHIKKTTGEEFPSSSTSAGNTLIFRPDADLPDGLYDVTYTLSNSVGESDKSPVLAPQLEINTIINN